MGKIGKPQKSRKHKKMKPTFDNSRYENTDVPIGGKRSKFHNLPVSHEDLDKQDIPRKVKDIMHIRSNLNSTNQSAKMSKNKNKKKFKRAAESTFRMERGISKPMQPIPRFVQGKHEKDKNFIRRIELEAHRVILKAQIEEKYQIELPDGTSNTPSIVIKKKTSEKKREKDKERKKKKVQIKKEKKQERCGDFSALKDEVVFGDVAMAPPSLTAKPRKATMDSEIPRPGKRSLILKDMLKESESRTSSQQTDLFVPGKRSLILKDMLKESESRTSSQQTDSSIRTNPKSQAHRQAGQTVKRKFLSPVQKQITDFQRQKAINLYRKMKDEKVNRPR